MILHLFPTTEMMFRMSSTNLKLKTAAIPAVLTPHIIFHFSCRFLSTAYRQLLLTEGNRVVSQTGELQSYLVHPDWSDSWSQVRATRVHRNAVTGSMMANTVWLGLKSHSDLLYLFIYVNQMFLSSREMLLFCKI